MSMRQAAFELLARPQAVPLAGRRVLVLGLGDSGLSAACWVAREGGLVRVADTRTQPPHLQVLRTRLPRAEARCGAFDAGLLDGVDLLCISPGLSLEEPLVRDAVARGMPVVGDVELFAWGLDKYGRGRIAAVTGTNGKTTVTALTAHLLRGAGLDAEAAGNISPPVLDALAARMDAGRLPEAWVLELSSYQLETTWSLAPDAATVLNLSEDHLDRYPGLPSYAAAKARILVGAATQVVNRDDPLVAGLAMAGMPMHRFGLGSPGSATDLGLGQRQGRTWIMQGEEALVPVDGLPIHGLHNAANVMAALALALALGAERTALLAALAGFRGLPHRLERVATRNGVDWYDDSKGTNVGATIAALRGLDRRAVLIAGGVGKGQDFSVLAPAVAERASRVLLIGEDAGRIEAALAGTGVPLERCASLEAAVARAAAQARAGEAVLLSPACASFDMFRDYKHRGEAFAEAVHALEGRDG
jgi:UDP-N-acetylmuramoylalanine--D-glutamate ligase